MADPRRLGITGAAASLAMLSPLASAPAPRLVWNVSASSPPGLYWLQPGRMPEPGDWVVVRTPARVRALAAARHYLPENVPLVKRVRASAGARICGNSAVLWVDRQPVATRLVFDPSRRALPRWEGCRTLGDGEYLVLGTTADSFDSRYFGPVGRADILGRAVPLWVR